MAQHIDVDTSRTPEPAEVGPDNAALRALLAKLARAVTSGDGKAAAAIWATPALVIGDDMALTVGSSADIQDVFGGAKAQYNARGITDTRPDILRLDWVTHRIAIVEVRWPYLAATCGTRRRCVPSPHQQGAAAESVARQLCRWRRCRASSIAMVSFVAGASRTLTTISRLYASERWSKL